MDKEVSMHSSSLSFHRYLRKSMAFSQHVNVLLRKKCEIMISVRKLQDNTSQVNWLTVDWHRKHVGKTTEGLKAFIYCSN